MTKDKIDQIIDIVLEHSIVDSSHDNIGADSYPIIDTSKNKWNTQSDYDRCREAIKKILGEL